MIIKLVLDLRNLTNFLYLFTRETLTISTFRKIVIHVLVFVIYSLFIIGVAGALIVMLQQSTIGKVFHTVELDTIVSNKNIYSFVAFRSNKDLECELYMPQSTCEFVKTRAQYVDFNLTNNLYEITVEATVISSGLKKNFYYDLDTLSPDPIKSTKLQGMMIPVSSGIFNWLYRRFISEEEVFSSRTMIVDFRFDNSPRVGILAFKEIKDETFIKNIRVHLDIKSNFLMKILHRYQIIVLFWLFAGIVWLMTAVYFLVLAIVIALQFLHFCEFVKTKQRKTYKRDQRERVIPRFVSVFFPIAKSI